MHACMRTPCREVRKKRSREKDKEEVREREREGEKSGGMELFYRESCGDVMRKSGSAR